MFEQLEFVVEVVDGTTPLPVAEAAEGTGCQYDDPQYGYENQQDH